MSTHCVFTFHVFTFHVFTFHVFTFHPLPICSSGDDWDIIGATSPRWRNWQTHCFEVAASNIVQVQILSWALEDPTRPALSAFCAGKRGSYISTCANCAYPLVENAAHFAARCNPKRANLSYANPRRS